MGKSVHDDVLDAALNYVKTNSAKICVCSAEPTSYAEANVTYMLAQDALVSGDFGSPANGDISGRKIAVPEVANFTITNTGSGTHVAIIAAATLLYVTTCPTLSLTAAGLVTVPTWDVEIEDPT